MFGLLTRLFTRSRYSELWCIGCKSRQRVREVGIVDAVNSKSSGRRLVGTCLSCGGRTSTFVPAA
jgi:hypothetical protein